MKVNHLSFLFSFLLCGGIFLFSLTTISSAEISQKYSGEAQKFEVSAYYSPLPNQEKYVSGSYAADLRMNGNGTNGADGTPVYVGMISAPSKYAFGTQIYIPGLGVGTVHDRGGAIYSTKGYDRLDVWFGKGDEGRIKALQWGRKMVDGVVLDTTAKNTLEISTAEISRTPNATTQNTLPAQPITNQEHEETIVFTNHFTRNFSRDDEDEEIKSLQKFLIQQDVFSGNQDINQVTNYYGKHTENSVFLFQKKHHILENWSDAGAGNWGPQTRKKANSVSQKASEISSRSVLHTPVVPEETHFTRNFSRDDEDEEIKSLQKFLIQQDVFSGNQDINQVTNYYGKHTENSVFLFQKKYHILENWSDAGAGNWGPQTRKKANSVSQKAS